MPTTLRGFTVERQLHRLNNNAIGLHYRYCSWLELTERGEGTQPTNQPTNQAVNRRANSETASVICHLHSRQGCWWWWRLQHLHCPRRMALALASILVPLRDALQQHLPCMSFLSCAHAILAPEVPQTRHPPRPFKHLLYRYITPGSIHQLAAVRIVHWRSALARWSPHASWRPCCKRGSGY